MKLKAPFPYYGGKSRCAEVIWAHLGDPKVYAEPFAGSLAVLLSRPPSMQARPREMVVDIDHHIVNFWRSVQHDPEGVAFHADYPTFHADLTARHKWLIKWGNQHKQKIIDDAEYFDTKVAGWWVWGISLWIGGGWCAEPVDNRRPTIDPRGGAKGIQSISKRPYIRDKGGERGIQALSKRPIIKSSGGLGGIQSIQHGNALFEFIGRLSERLKNVIVLGGDWSKCLGDTPLMHTPDSPKPPVSVLLDPPYLTEKRTTSLYISDIDGTSDHVALQSWKWALDNAQKYKIAYCCHEGDFELPEGWIKHTQKFPSTKFKDKSKQEDCIMFSPLCHSEKPQKEMAL